MNPNCYFCGKFVSWRDHISWTRYGSSYDMEPPDPDFAHPKCWNLMPKKERSLTESICWLGPVHHVEKALDSTPEDQGDENEDLVHPNYSQRGVGRGSKD